MSRPERKREELSFVQTEQIESIVRELYVDRLQPFLLGVNEQLGRLRREPPLKLSLNNVTSRKVDGKSLTDIRYQLLFPNPFGNLVYDHPFTRTIVADELPSEHALPALKVFRQFFEPREIQAVAEFPFEARYHVKLYLELREDPKVKADPVVLKHDLPREQAQAIERKVAALYEQALRPVLADVRQGFERDFGTVAGKQVSLISAEPPSDGFRSFARFHLLFPAPFSEWVAQNASLVIAQAKHEWSNRSSDHSRSLGTRTGWHSLMIAAHQGGGLRVTGVLVYEHAGERQEVIVVLDLKQGPAAEFEPRKRV